MMIIFTYILASFAFSVKDRKISATTRHYNLQGTPNTEEIEIPAPGPIRMKDLYQNDESDASSDDIPIDDGKFFYPKPTRTVGTISKEQYEMLYDIYDTYYRLDKKIQRIEDEKTRNTFYDMYRTTIIFLHKFHKSQKLEVWEYLRINRLLTKLERVFKSIDESIRAVLRYQEQDKITEKIQRDLVYLEKNVFNRLYK